MPRASTDVRGSQATVTEALADYCSSLRDCANAHNLLSNSKATLLRSFVPYYNDDGRYRAMLKKVRESVKALKNQATADKDADERRNAALDAELAAFLKSAKQKKSCECATVCGVPSLPARCPPPVFVTHVQLFFCMLYACEYSGAGD